MHIILHAIILFLVSPSATSSAIKVPPLCNTVRIFFFKLSDSKILHEGEAIYVMGLHS